MRLVAAALLALALPAQAQMYKCVDEHGKTNYRDQPAPGCKAVDIRPSPPLSGSVQAPPESFAVQDAELKRRQLEREAAEAKEREAREAHESRCARLRREQAMLASGVRVSSLDARGERVYMDDATREGRLAVLAQELRSCP